MAAGVAALIFLVPFVALPAAGAVEPEPVRGGARRGLGLRGPAAARRRAGPRRGRAARAGDPLPQSTYDIVRLGALLQWLVLAGRGLAVVLLGLLGRGRRLGRVLPAAALAGLAAAVLVADLFRANMGFNPAIPIDHAEQPSTGALRYLESRRPNRFAGFNRPGIGQLLQPDLSMRYDLYDARGYDYPVDPPLRRLLEGHGGAAGRLRPAHERAQPTRGRCAG